MAIGLEILNKRVFYGGLHAKVLGTQGIRYTIGTSFLNFASLQMVVTAFFVISKERIWQGSEII